MLSPARLALLVAVADEGSLARAAERLQYSPSAVSQGIAALERDAGATLLVRRAGREPLGLTQPGVALLAHARRIVAALQLAEAELAGTAGAGAGERSIRLVLASPAATDVVADAMSALRREHPDLAVELERADAGDALTGMLKARWDLALVPAHAPPDDPALERFTLLEAPWHVLLPSGHPLAAGERVEIGALREEPWILAAKPAEPELEALSRAAAAAGCAPRPAIACTDPALVGPLVASGAGVGLIPAAAGRSAPPGCALRMLAPRLVHQTSAVLPRQTRAPHTARLALAALTRAARASGPSDHERNAANSPSPPAASPLEPSSALLHSGGN